MESVEIEMKIRNSFYSIGIFFACLFIFGIIYIYNIIQNIEIPTSSFICCLPVEKSNFIIYSGYDMNVNIVFSASEEIVAKASKIKIKLFSPNKTIYEQAVTFSELIKCNWIRTREKDYKSFALPQTIQFKNTNSENLYFLSIESEIEGIDLWLYSYRKNKFKGQIFFQAIKNPFI